jgi:hypothetical protein
VGKVRWVESAVTVATVARDTTEESATVRIRLPLEAPAETAVWVEKVEPGVRVGKAATLSLAEPYVH